MPDRCPTCRASQKRAVRSEWERQRRNDPATREEVLEAGRKAYQRKGKPERTDERRKADLEAYRRRVATPEGRARVSAVQRATNIKKKYGITVAEFDAKLIEQGGVCAICRTAEAGGRYGIWHIDHDHETGAVRGLLCTDCNLGLGRFRDDPVVLSAAVAYLSLWGRPLPS